MTGKHKIKKNGLKKTRLAFLTALSFFIASAEVASSSFLHAPHDDAHGIACIDCHEFSLTDATSWGAPQATIDDTVKNFVCLKCHGPAGSAPTKAMHSDLSLNGTATWTTECVDCHAPHFQRQLNGVADISENFLLTDMYLVTGIINSITPAGADTTITYTLGAAQSKWSDPATWSAKTGAGRGLIFVADAANPKGLTYETLSADGTTITVIGAVDPAMAGKTFGLLYGQFLKNNITTILGDQTVSFYSPYGDFVDDSGSTAPTGVCQVCHTNVIYWTNDGANNTHNAQSRCTLCHDAALGFKFTGHDHTLTLSASIGCADCHTDPDIAGQVHFANCDTCHSSPRQEVIDAIAAGTGAECITCHVTNFTTIHTAVLLIPDTIHNTIVTTGATSCASCHSDPPPLVDAVDPKIHNTCVSCHGGINGTLSSLATGITAPGNCATCHTDTFELIHAATSADHSNLVTATGTQCISCHTGTALVDPFDPKVHNACATCHDANGGLLSLAQGKSFAVGGNCTTCHIDPFDTVHPATIDHTPIITVGTLSCASCHSAPPPLVDPVNPKVHNTCGSCHDTAGALISLANEKSFAVGGDCATCHTAPFDTVHPGTTDHTNIVTTIGTQCGTCHTSTLLVDAADPKVHNACATCHDATGALVSLAIGQSAPGNCNSCHGADFTTIHPDTINHNALVTVGTSSCSNCHTDPPPLVDPLDPKVHNACITCHDTNGGLISLAVGKTFALGGDCATCHAASFDTIHPATTDHTGIVTTTGTQCGSCHTSSALIDTLDPKVHNSCASCHEGNGALISLAIGQSAPGNCNSCHGADFTIIHPDTINHNALVTVGTSSCSSCHTDPPPLVDAVDPKIHNACISCHDTNGGLISLAIGKSFALGGDCATCHTAPFDTIHPATTDHTGIVTTTGTQCASCHTSTALIDALDPKVHNSCASCHDGNGALVSLAIGQSAPGNCNSCHGADFTSIHPVTVNHSALIETGSTSCASCHSNPPPLVDPADPKVHNACISCHDSNGALINLAIGKSFAVAGDCATCHGADYFTQHTHDHSTTVTGSADCVSCHQHNDPNIITGIHTNTCETCHSSALPAVIAAIAGGQAECIDCHDAHNGPAIHNNLGAPASCATCHTDKISGTDFTYIFNNHGPHAIYGFTELDRCQRCHNSVVPEVAAAINTGKGATGTPVNCENCHVSQHIAITNPTAIHDYVLTSTGGTCGNCHIENYWSHLDMNATTSCGTCHASANQDEFNALHQNNCLVCHLSPRSEVITAINTGIAGTPVACITCHAAYGTDFFTGHQSPNHTNLVTTSGTSCANCHTDTLVDNADPKVHNSCSTCHDANGVLVSLASGKSGTGNCTTCHGSVFTIIHPDTVDHSAIVKVNATSCASCHNDPPPLVDAVDPKVHNGCSSCHDVNGALISLAIGKSFTMEGDCATCHIDPFTTIHPTNTDHSGIVTTSGTQCGTCHTNTLLVDAADPKVHNSCSSCHDANGGLISLAIGKSAPGNCNTCHGAVFTTIHPDTVDHSQPIQASIGCGDCHTGTALVNPVDPKVHNSCASCHDANGALISLAIGNTSPNECITCHGTNFNNIHASPPSHNPPVTVSGTSSCGSCHTNTLVNASDPKVHNACTSCHGGTNGTITPLSRADGITLGVPSQNCETCHTEGFNNVHTHIHTGISTTASCGTTGCHDSGNIVATEHKGNCDTCHASADPSVTGAIAAGTAECITCHADNYHSIFPEPYTQCADCHLGTHTAWKQGPTESMHQRHLVKSDISCNDCHGLNSGGCRTCHQYGQHDGFFPGDNDYHDSHTSNNNITCTDCHITVPGADHAPLGYVTSGGTQDYYGTTCASCHDSPVGSVDPVPVTHKDNCNLCHTTIPNLQPGLIPGDCVNCHTTQEHTLWTRYMDTCATSGCHDTFDGGPGGFEHERHTGGWASYPSGYPSSMWVSGFPLNPSCETCHLPSTDNTKGQGCATCHTFEGKGDTHLVHSDPPKKGGLGISCSACHWNS